jgi:hypothetical protein
MSAELDALLPALMRRSRGGRCELAIPGVCRGRGSDRAHRQRRRESNNSLANVMWVCRPCHRWTERPEHRELCLRHGFILESWQNPEEVPVIPLPLQP